MLFLYVFLSISLLGWILYPILVNFQSRSGDPLLQERIQSAEAALQQLYAQGRQKISEDDFPKIERHLMVSLARLLQRAGLPPTEIAQRTAEKESSQAPPPEPSESPVKEEAPFCGECGTKNAGFTYCPSCGKRLHAA